MQPGSWHSGAGQRLNIQQAYDPSYSVLMVSCPADVHFQIPIKGCRDVCFSNGGQYFAAINGITLSIYNTYTCECVGNLRGHNGKVCC